MEKHPLFVHGLSETEVVRLLSSPKVSERLDHPIGDDVRAVPLSGRRDTYQVTGSNGNWILRFPRDDAHLSVLKKEERVQTDLRERVVLRLPDTRVIDDLDGHPVFAIHGMIAGEPLTTDLYRDLSPEARDRLIGDLVRFYHETHGIPLQVACDWLDIPFDGERTAEKLAAAHGEHAWFGLHATAEMRPQLKPLLDDTQEKLFEDTVGLFQGQEVQAEDMVFGHGDIHGYNVAMGRDDLGSKIVGVFDLECAGILDIHEDLFRLSLVSEDLIERVMAAYLALPGQTRSIDRDRIAIYYRAFLFHLMIGKTGQRLDHLKRMLREHVEYYAVTFGGLR